MLPCRHVYVPYAEAAQRPNIVVDGAAHESSVLTLSHWPKSGTPWPLKADTSVGVVFNYLDNPAWHRAAPAVTNNHFDEDGLIGLYCLIEPEHALARRALLIDASSAGDFSVCRSRDAARIAFAISRLADRDVSPWGVDRFPEDYSDYCTFVYTRLLQQLGTLIDDVEGHRALWADEDALLTPASARSPRAKRRSRSARRSISRSCACRPIGPIARRIVMRSISTCRSIAWRCTIGHPATASRRCAALGSAFPTATKAGCRW